MANLLNEAYYHHFKKNAKIFFKLDDQNSHLLICRKYLIG